MLLSSNTLCCPQTVQVVVSKQDNLSPEALTNRPGEKCQVLEARVKTKPLFFLELLVGGYIPVKKTRAKTKLLFFPEFLLGGGGGSYKV